MSSWFHGLIILLTLSSEASVSAKALVRPRKAGKLPRVELLRSDKTLAVIERDPSRIIVYCALYDLEKYTTVLDQVEEKFAFPSKPCKFEKMVRIIQDCNSIVEYEDVPGLVSPPKPELVFNSTQIKSLWKGIIPGTKWCGVGDQAKSFHDLGPHTQVDRCCRVHDHCPVRMGALSAEYGTINLSLYTRSHCTCDQIFFSCLKSTHQPLADILGKFYFNILQIGCIEEADEEECEHGQRCNYSRSLGLFRTRRRMKLRPNNLHY